MALDHDVEGHLGVAIGQHLLQLAMVEPLPPGRGPIYPRRGLALVQRMNSKRKELQDDKEKQLKEEIRVKLQNKIRMLESLVPKPQGGRPTKAEIDDRDSDIALLVAQHHIFASRGGRHAWASAGAISMKVNVVREIAFETVTDTQRQGVALMLWRCRRWRELNFGKTALFWDHEFDDTSNRMMLYTTRRRVKAPKVVASQTVMVQSSKLHFSFVPNDGTKPMRIMETWLCPALLLDGKSGPYMVIAVERALTLQFRDDNDFLAEILASVDFFAFTPTSDQGCSNLSGLKFVAQFLEQKSTELCVTTADVSPCLVHQNLGTMRHCPDLLKLVCKLYSLSQLSRLHSTHDDLEVGVSTILSIEMKRYPTPPPTEKVLEGQRLINMLIDMNAAYMHSEKGTPKMILTLLRRVLAMINDGLQGGGMVHYCWDESRKAPCCKDLDDSIRKTTEAVVDLFIVLLRISPTMGKFTNILMGITAAVIGYLLKRLLPRALYLKLQHFVGQTGLEASVKVEDAGAGDKDLAILLKKRRRSVGEFLVDPATMWSMVVSCLVLQPADALTRDFFGFRKQRPSMQDLAGSEDGLIGKCQERYYQLLSHWVEGGDSPWHLLSALSTPWRGNLVMMRRARNDCLILAAGVFRLILRFSELPLEMSVLKDGGAAQQDKEKVKRAIYDVDAELLDPFTRAIRRRY